MAKQQTTAIAKNDENASVPDYLKNGVSRGTGLESMDISDMQVPRIKLLHGTSKEPETFDTAKQGQFWHDGFDFSLGEEFEFIIAIDKKKYLLMAPLHDGQGILARAEDAKHWNPPEGSFDVKYYKDRKETVVWKLAPTVEASGLDKFGSGDPKDKNSKPAATLFYDYLVYLPEHPEMSPVVFSVARSQIKKAKKELHKKIALLHGSGRPMQSLKFKVRALKEKNEDNQDYYNIAFASAGFATEQEFNKVLAIKERFGDFRVADEEGAAADAENVDNASKGAPDDGSGEY